MTQYQRKPVKLEQFTKTPDVNCPGSGGEKPGSEKKGQRKHWVNTVLLVVGTISEIMGIAQGVLAFMPSDGAGTQVNTGGGDATVVGQYIKAEGDVQIYTQVGDGAEAASEVASKPILEGLSEEERIYVDGLSREEQLACAYDYIQNREYQKAEQTLGVLLENEGLSQDMRAAALYNLGLARYYQRQTALAREAFRDSTKIKGSAQAYYCLGIVNHEMGEYKQAVDAYDKAFLYENSGAAMVDFYLARAAACERWKDAPEGKAREDYQSALELDPENPFALAGLGRLGGSGA